MSVYFMKRAVIEPFKGCINILSSTRHHISVQQKLLLKNQVFPYPPFSDYIVEKPDENVVVTQYMDPTDDFEFSGRIGGTRSAHTTFEFKRPGTYNITIVKKWFRSDDKRLFSDDQRKCICTIVVDDSDKKDVEAKAKVLPKKLRSRL